ncbi:MAG: tetratricopeptide repeat protein [Candidatus Thiodiazotropha sp. (ex. Lucinisca nassula)]|nr:tetratricopeptide repeat protein [Candidatus Thiodiazotropha sp. (ex. Lucinisca nassula)]
MNRSATLICLLFLSACGSNPTLKSPTSNSLAGNESTPVPAEATADQLTTDLVYHTLASEIAAQRGEQSMAFDHALQVARESRDPLSAERATSLALQANQPEKALTAARLWIDIDPQELKAYQIAAIINIRANQLNEAISHLQQVIKIANRNGQSGYVQAAAIAEKSGSPEKALALMQQLVPEDANSSSALYALALVANRASQRALALEYIDQSLILEPSSTQSLVLRAHTLIAMKKEKQGIEFLQQAVEKYPSDIKLRHAYARILLEINQIEASLQQFLELNQQAPDNTDFSFSLGMIYMQLDQYDKAQQYLSILTQSRAKRDEANFYLGAIAEEQEAYEQALDRYSRVEGKHLADAQVRIAKILSDQGNLKQARETLQRLRVNQSRNQLKFYMIEAELLREAREYSTAHEVYSKALERFSDNTDLLYARGLNAADLKRVDLLEQDLRRILDSHPQHADALNALGYTLADQTDRLQEARQYIVQALALKPESPAVLDSMGWVEYRLGNLPAALEHLEKAAEISNDAEIASHLGEVLWVMGEQERALEIWKAALEREPDNRFVRPAMLRLGAED